HFGALWHTWQPPLAFLAVDLFFVLSGFVLSLNYDRRLAEGMTGVAFMRLRMIRLLPLLVVGTLAAVVASSVMQSGQLRSGEAAVSSVLAILAIPTPPVTQSLVLFPLNPPFWSLFFELWIANLMFALLWNRLRGATLWSVIAIGAVGLLVAERYFHSMDTGWAWRNVAGGFAR